MKLKRYILVIIVLFSFSCVPPNHLFYTDYVVFAEQHYSLPRAVVPVPSQTVTFDFKTNDSWKWQPPAPSGWSKIGGVTWKQPHKQSVRTVFDGKYIGWYMWIDGVSPQENREQQGRLFIADLNTTYTCTAGYRHGGLYLHIYNNNDITQDTTIHYICKNISYPPLFDAPYVGGTYTLNHDWSVPIKFK